MGTFEWGNGHGRKSGLLGSDVNDLLWPFCRGYDILYSMFLFEYVW